MQHLRSPWRLPSILSLQVRLWKFDNSLARKRLTMLPLSLLVQPLLHNRCETLSDWSADSESAQSELIAADSVIRTSSLRSLQLLWGFKWSPDSLNSKPFAPSPSHFARSGTPENLPVPEYWFKDCSESQRK